MKAHLTSAFALGALLALTPGCHRAQPRVSAYEAYIAKVNARAAANHQGYLDMMARFERERDAQGL